MSWESVTVKQSQKFGDLKVVDLYYDRPGWVVCACWCGNHRGVQEQKLLSGEITACTGCTARTKMERLAKEA